MTDAHTPQMAIPVDIAGRRINLIPLEPAQLIGLQMAESETLPEAARLKITCELLLSMMPTMEDRAHVAEAFATRKISFDELNLTLKAIATTKPVDVAAPAVEEQPAKVVPPRARKAAAKKTAKRA